MPDINVTVTTENISVTKSDATPINATVSDATPINATVSDASPITATVTNATPITVSIVSASGSTGNLQNRVELESQFKVAQSTDYTEYTYTGDQLTSIDVWDTSSKGTKLFSKAFTYSGSQLTQSVLTDEVNSNTLTVVFGYTGDQLTTKTRTVA